MNVILGPGRCQECRRMVWYGTSEGRGRLPAWRNPDGTRHGPGIGCAKTTRETLTEG